MAAANEQLDADKKDESRQRRRHARDSSDRREFNQCRRQQEDAEAALSYAFQQLTDGDILFPAARFAKPIEYLLDAGVAVVSSHKE